eukprot:PhM_4_TR10056/c11_g2_i1/m.42468
MCRNKKERERDRSVNILLLFFHCLFFLPTYSDSMRSVVAAGISLLLLMFIISAPLLPVVSSTSAVLAVSEVTLNTTTTTAFSLSVWTSQLVQEMQTTYTTNNAVSSISSQNIVTTLKTLSPQTSIISLQFTGTDALALHQHCTTVTLAAGSASRARLGVLSITSQSPSSTDGSDDNDDDDQWVPLIVVVSAVVAIAIVVVCVVLFWVRRVQRVRKLSAVDKDLSGGQQFAKEGGKEQPEPMPPPRLSLVLPRSWGGAIANNQQAECLPPNVDSDDADVATSSTHAAYLVEADEITRRSDRRKACEAELRKGYVPTSHGGGGGGRHPTVLGDARVAPPPLPRLGEPYGFQFHPISRVEHL